MLPKEQLEELKKQILTQVEANFPEDQKELTKQPTNHSFNYEQRIITRKLKRNIN